MNKAKGDAISQQVRFLEHSDRNGYLESNLTTTWVLPTQWQLTCKLIWWTSKFVKGAEGREPCQQQPRRLIFNCTEGENLCGVFLHISPIWCKSDNWLKPTTSDLYEEGIPPISSLWSRRRFPPLSLLIPGGISDWVSKPQHASHSKYHASSPFMSLH